MRLDVQTCDHLLSTTRAVRKRLDLTRPVPREIILECIALSQQAPTGSNSQGWRWLVVDDPNLRRQLADLYRRAGETYLTTAQQSAPPGQTKRVFDSAVYLMDHLHEVPVHVIPCIHGRQPAAGGAGFFASIFPAVWSFQLGLRSRGLGSCLTTLHLAYETEARKLLNLPDTLTQAALLPVAYTVGDDFKKASRPPPETITHWNTWS